MAASCCVRFHRSCGVRLTNGLRAFIVMAVASATDMRVLAGKDHVIFGWALFLLVMIALYFVAERFSDRRPKHAA